MLFNNVLKMSFIILCTFSFLSSFASEAPKRGEGSSQQSEEFDKYGFRSDGTHQNGTLRDNKKYDFRGFRKNGKHRNGTKRDEEGYDVFGFLRTGLHQNGTDRDSDGYNQYGFLEEGTHRNGTIRDGKRYDARGFKANGRHRNGTRVCPDGYDLYDFDRDGLHKNGTERDSQDYDRYGFLPEGRHRNGTLKGPRGYDFIGFRLDGSHRNGSFFGDNHLTKAELKYHEGRDFEGYDEKGFLENAKHRNGTKFGDEGYSLLGFLASGLHMNGTEFGDDGFTLRGFQEDGLHRNGSYFDVEGLTLDSSLYFEGRDHLGYDERGFLISGLHRSGSYFDGEKKAFDGSSYYNKYDCGKHDHSGVSVLGFDLFGHKSISVPRRKEPGPLRADGYNEEGYDEEDFYRELPFGGGKFDQDGFDQSQKYLGLISKSDFEENGFDAITVLNLDEREDTDLDRLLVEYGQKCFSIDGFDINNAEEREEILDPAASYYFNDNDYTDEKFKNHLRKALYFCENFLKPASSEIDEVDLNKTRINRSSFLSDKIAQTDYKAVFTDWLTSKHWGENEDKIYEVLENFFSQKDFINSAGYPDFKDERFNLNRQKKIEDLRLFLDRHKSGSGVKRIWEARVTLLLLAIMIKKGVIDSNEAGIILPDFLHGARNCPDAKRRAIIQVQNSIKEIKSALRSYKKQFSGDGLRSKLALEASSLKYDLFSTWLRSLVVKVAEQETPYNTTWDRFAPHIGLEAVGANYNLKWDLDYINAEKIVIPNKVTVEKFLSSHPGGNFTVKKLTEELGFKPEVLHRSFEEPNFLTKLAADIFGPIGTLSSEEITLTVLLRLGFLRTD